MYEDILIDDIKGFCRRNPNAIEGYKIGPFGWRARIDMNKQNKPVFRKALRESIQKEGIRNPLLAWSFDEGLFVGFGMGRLKAAKELGFVEVPMIINDFTGNYDEAALVTPGNFAEFFTDVPLTWEFGKYGFTYHYNLTPSTRTLHDPGGTKWYKGDVSDFHEEFPYLRGHEELQC